MGLRGLQTEILASLSLVMLTATAMLGLLVQRTHESQLDRLRELAAASLVREASSPLPRTPQAGLRWWRVRPPGGPAGGAGGSAPAPLRALAAEARTRGAALLRAGAPWEPLRFAAPVGSAGEVAVAEIPASLPRSWALGFLVANFLVFTAFGATLLRQRVVRPLQRLASSARAFGAGERVRAPLEGARETVELAQTFNEMAEALERRSEALEKAVGELRESNRSLREARAGLDRAERLASVGRLAAGVAHEVGNPMGALLAFLDLARRDPGLSEQGRERLSKAAQQGERVRGILRQLLDYSRPRRASRVPVDLGPLVEETLDLVRAQRRYAGVAMELRSEGEPPRALADPSATAQILLNLLLNAADAASAAGLDAPHIQVLLDSESGPARAGEPPEAAARRRRADVVVCRVQDDGPGVPPEDRERIFDPFFTTKPPGEGTGLGLANAVRLAEEMGGSLDLEESPQGACFALRLPAAGAEGGSRVRSAG